MKSLLILSALLLLASCGNNKLRFQRVKLFNKQEIVHIDDAQVAEKTKPILQRTTARASSSDAEKHSKNSADETSSKPITTESADEEIVVPELPISVSDTLENKEDDETKAIALKAEKISTIAIWMNRTVLIVLLLSAIIALLMFDGLPLLGGAIFGLVLAIGAMIAGFVSKSKSHNTPLGSKQSSRAIVTGGMIALLLGLILFLYFQF
ncbi:MAG: hypothetical protein P8P74_13410 [Crocinitomicaceae bacterium]|nr:hypothetical protein [Crocinitomicaceae bacterium]